MAYFQRSYSKVWWGSLQENSRYNDESEFHSLNSTHSKVPRNLSRISETAEESSKSWSSHDSPGSLKSQDSGFSDNDDLPNILNTKLSPTKSEKMHNNSNSTVDTPPTVIRRKKFSTSNSNDRSFSSLPSSPTSLLKTYEFAGKIDTMNFNSSKSDLDEKKDSDSSSCICSNSQKSTLIKRRKGFGQKARKNILTPSTTTATSSSSINGSSNNSSIYSSRFNDYNNETILIGAACNDDDSNNLATKFEREMLLSPSRRVRHDNDEMNFVTITSTPKSNIAQVESNVFCSPEIAMRGIMPLNNYDYSYPNLYLNSNSLSLQYWLNDIRTSYCHEVMSTLQTKSIAQEAFRNVKITSTTVAMIIRQLQTKSIALQGEFEKVERILRDKITYGDDADADADAGGRGSCLDQTIFNNCQELIQSVHSFVKVLERRNVLFNDAPKDRKRFNDNIDNIKLTVKDLSISLEKHHYLELQSLLDDIQVLKHYILITLRLVFEKLVKVIIVNIDNSKCDLMLKANLNTISTLSNMDYCNGFASLNDAFNKNETVRVLLLICLEHKLSSVRALALRALATICSTLESIRQMCETKGIEIVKDILCYDPKNNYNRTEPEKREAVSLLTQITAPWHGKDHKVAGLKDCVESIVEGLTDIIVNTNCCQTLLLCAASLNNLSRLEVTSLYSIMSNETVLKLKDAAESRGPGASIFLYEQIVNMLHNMSVNKKCHCHLANSNIINFLTFIFRSQFYEKFISRAETEAHRRTIRTILHIFNTLVHESVVGQEILQHNFLPIFSKIEKNLNENSEHMRDISFLNRQLNESLSHHKNASFHRSSSVINPKSSDGSSIDSTNFEGTGGGGRGSGGGYSTGGGGAQMNITRYESYV